MCRRSSTTMNWYEVNQRLDQSNSGDGHASSYRVCRYHENNVRLGFLFREFNFRGLPVNRENHENWLPLKFQAYSMPKPKDLYSYLIY